VRADEIFARRRDASSSQAVTTGGVSRACRALRAKAATVLPRDASGRPSSGRSVDAPGEARRLHRTPRLVEGAAGFVPFEPAIGEDAARLSLEIADQLLVLNLEHDARRQDAAPMLRQSLIRPVIAPQLAEIVGKRHFLAEQYGETGKASVNRVAARMDDARIRQRQVNEAEEAEPTPMKFDSEGAVGKDRWDAFAAECGVLLLAEDTTDLLARRLVAASVMAFHYGTTEIALSRAMSIRDRLGQDFDRMLALAVRWAGLRTILPSATDTAFQEELERGLEQRVSLADEFVKRRLTADYHAVWNLSRVMAGPGASVTFYRFRPSNGLIRPDTALQRALKRRAHRG
jgi:hypothetical protein